MKIETLLVLVILLVVVVSGVLLWRINRLETILQADQRGGNTSAGIIPVPGATGSGAPASNVPPPDDPLPPGSR